MPDWLNLQWQNQSSLPWNLPQIRFRPLRAQNLGFEPFPTHTVQISAENPFQRPEAHRRRQDDKVRGNAARTLWNAQLAFTNKTYQRFSEWMDLQHAFAANWGDPIGTIMALAMNEAVDRAYGARAQTLKERVYSDPGYRLPVGIDTIGSVMSGRIPSPFF